MGELGLRWILAGIVALASGWTGMIPFSVAWPIALGWACLSTVALRFDRQNAGYAGGIAVLDAVGILCLAASAHLLGSLSWLATLPLVYAVVKFGAPPLAVVSLTAGALMAVNTIATGAEPTPVLYVQLVGVMAMGIALRPVRAEATVGERVGSTDPFGAHDPDTFLGVRESFRKLKTLYRQLEIQSRRDRLTARLLETRFGDDTKMTSRLADRIKELTGASKAIVYVVLEDRSSFASRAATGNDGPEALLHLNPEDSVGRIKHAAGLALNASVALEPANALTNVPLAFAGRVIGLCALAAPQEKLDEVRSSIEELAPMAAALLVEAETKAERERTRRMDRLRTDLNLTTRGKRDPALIASRFCREISSTYDLDHVSVWKDRNPLATEGREMDVSDWVAQGELIAPVAGDHPAMGNGEATRRRVGTVVVLAAGGYSAAFIAAAEGALSSDSIDTLRHVTTDLAWTLAPDPSGPSGLLDPTEFRSRMSVPGALVLLEVTERASRARTDVEGASKRLRERALSMIEPGWAILIRPEGDVLAHLPEATLGVATDWGLKVAKSIPGLRVRTASLWPRTHIAVGAEEFEPEDLLTQSKI